MRAQRVPVACTTARSDNVVYIAARPDNCDSPPPPVPDNCDLPPPVPDNCGSPPPVPDNCGSPPPVPDNCGSPPSGRTTVVCTALRADNCCVRHCLIAQLMNLSFDAESSRRSSPQTPAPMRPGWPATRARTRRREPSVRSARDLGCGAVHPHVRWCTACCRRGAADLGPAQERHKALRSR
jgi:hypothetical protein